MLAKVRSAVSGRTSTEDSDNSDAAATQPPRIGMVIDMADANFIGGLIPVMSGPEKMRYPYSRPEFLYFSDEDIAISADQTARPVLCPKDPSRMPVYAGYAEVINAGKTEQNEDQASARILNLVQQGYEAEQARELDAFERNTSVLSRQSRASSEIRRRSSKTNFPRRHSDEDLITLPERRLSMDDGPAMERAEAAFFAILDGHAGSGAAIMAANCLHEHVRARLSQVLETAIHLDRQETLFGGYCRSPSAHALVGAYNPQSSNRSITCDSLVIGAMEAAFVDMDEQIAEEKQLWKIPGGCAAIAALFFLGKIYVANAGDCRALLVSSNHIQQLSEDFTPETERKRLQYLAYKNPDLVGNCFSRYEYSRFLTRRDLKKKVLYRDWYMDGWAAKTVRDSDLRPPLISDRGKKRRLLNTIGVSRGFGDHHLLTADDKIPIKPFLSPVPEVRVVDLHKLDSLSDKDVLILASDGLWDVLNNEDVALIVKAALNNNETAESLKYSCIWLYTMAAHELAIAARGNPTESYRWQMSSGGCASSDDITVFVISLKYALAAPTPDDDDDVELLQ
uniref:PPM-type phosphatase domain-containing protein n=1 Tax=Ascaris lumbricoides TaxID=6252 RepID=A0A0M3HVW8_ASCLU